MWLTCDTVHCLGERALFSSFVTIFWWFLPSNAPIMLYNICYCGSSINEQNTLSIPKYRGLNLACWCLHLWLLWMAFTCCCPLSWQLIWFWSEVVDPCFIHYHIFIQKLLFCCIETVANNTLNCQLVLDWLWANTAPTLNIAFSLTNVHAKQWIHCLLISSIPLLSHATSIHNRLKRVCRVFLVFSGTTAEFGWSEHSASFVLVWAHLKPAYNFLAVIFNGAESE